MISGVLFDIFASKLSGMERISEESVFGKNRTDFLGMNEYIEYGEFC